MIEIFHHANRGPRSNMEDACAAAVPEIVTPVRRQIAVAVLCDGVGGANAGEIASDSASRMLVSDLCSRLPHLALTDPNSPIAPDTALALVEESLIWANDLVLTKSRERPECAGMATTAVVVVIVDGLLYVGWAGDSRAYLQRNGTIRRLTLDHSQVEEHIEAGLISPAEAAHHPNAHTITQYLGMEEGFRPETLVIRLLAGDTMVLCSDGVTDVLNDDQIARYLADWEQAGCPFDEWSERLVQEALSAHTRDNTSVVLVRFQPDGSGDDRRVSAVTAHYSRSLSRILSPLSRR